MKQYRLKEEHEFSKRFEELCAKANELGIDIQWNYSNVIPTWVKDTKNNKEYQLKYTDGGETVSEFPPTFEYKLVFEQE